MKEVGGCLIIFDDDRYRVQKEKVLGYFQN